MHVPDVLLHFLSDLMARGEGGFIQVPQGRFREEWGSLCHWAVCVCVCGTHEFVCVWYVCAREIVLLQASQNWSKKTSMCTFTITSSLNHHLTSDMRLSELEIMKFSDTTLLCRPMRQRSLCSGGRVHVQDVSLCN